MGATTRDSLQNQVNIYITCFSQRWTNVETTEPMDPASVQSRRTSYFMGTYHLPLSYTLGHTTCQNFHKYAQCGITIVGS